MGVEQTYYDAFTRAREYMKSKEGGSRNSRSENLRKDLELDALSEILNAKRFITCHSYQQGEINMLMHVGDSMGFRVNTFTHILEGYKVADKMKAHGVGASTFSDWWAYKYEVIEAIPYNATILDRMGVVTAINSDDAEMGRRLNQEAAKAVKYGGLSEEEALKFVTLNPAKLLHLDHRMGSITKGKDADIVLWSDHPLSVYSVAEFTFVDGALYYSREIHNGFRERDHAERKRLVKKMMEAKGNKIKSPSYIEPENKHCINEEDLLQ
jgi:imidazolonepropionase-like amidohydrolase